MSDIVERLNDPLECPTVNSVFDLCREAADEIERLTAEIGRYRAVLLEIETLSVTANGIHRDPTNWMREIAHEALSAGEERDE